MWAVATSAKLLLFMEVCEQIVNLHIKYQMLLRIEYTNEL